MMPTADIRTKRGLRQNALDMNGPPQVNANVSVVLVPAFSGAESIFLPVGLNTVSHAGE